MSISHFREPNVPYRLPRESSPHRRSIERGLPSGMIEVGIDPQQNNAESVRHGKAPGKEVVREVTPIFVVPKAMTSNGKAVIPYIWRGKVMELDKLTVVSRRRRRGAIPKWFVRDRFGMFIHWGLYALPARHEWVKNHERMSNEQYEKYFRHLTPTFPTPSYGRRRRQTRA